MDKFELPSDATNANDILTEFERQMGAAPLSPEERDALLKGDLPTDVES